MKTITSLILTLITLNSFCQTEVFFNLSSGQTVLKSNATDTIQYRIDSIRTDTLFKEDTVIQIRATIPSFRHIIPNVYSTYGVRFNLHYEAGGFNYNVDSTLVQIHNGTHSDLSVNGDLTDTIYLDSTEFIDYAISNVNNGGRYKLTSTVFHNVDTFFVSSVITSLDEIQKETLRVYPNPTKDYLNIEGYNGKKFELIDMKGTVLKRGIITNKIYLRNLMKGTYVLRVENNFMKILKE